MSATEDEVNKVLETHRTWGIELENRTKASLRSYVEYHDEIHLQIAGLSGSKRLQEFISRLLFESTRFRMSDPAMSQGVISLGKEREDTRKILLAIARQDADSARRIMVEHIAEAKQRSLEYLLKRGGVASVSSV